ncbi:MAG: hypothetical protein ACPLXP_02410 [Microgenomates group bacterium]
MKIVNLQDIEELIQIPDMMSLTELRYGTVNLQKKLNENKAIILLKRNKKIAIMLPIKTSPKTPSKISPVFPTYKMGKILGSLRRKDIYNEDDQISPL